MTKLARIAAALALSSAGAAPALADFKLTILHTNDIHSRAEPINKYDSTCSAKEIEEKACFGGYARVVAAIAAKRATVENPLVLDAGDQFQGSLFYNQYKGAAAAEFMKAAGYEAMAVGNHEFDDGPKVLEPFVAMLPFPVLMANADTTREPELHKSVLPSTVVEKGGERIGIIGLTPQDNPEIASPGPTIDFLDPIPAVKAEVERLTKDEVTKIVLLSHSGYEIDKRIAAAVDGIDVIVGGHTHTLLSNTDKAASGAYPTLVRSPDGTEVPIVQAYAYSKYLGQLDLVFDNKGRVTSAKGEPILLDSNVPEDAAMKARVAELGKPLEEIRAKVVASTTAPIDGSRETCRVRECEMGDLVADAMLDRVKDQGVTIAYANGGGLRASIDAGEVTMGEVLTVLPFQNTLATFELKGADLKAALENGVGSVEELAGRFPQVAGLKFTWDPRKPKGERIVSVEVKEGSAFVPLDPEKVYLVVSNNYMRGGGDGYKVFAEKGMKAYDYGPSLEETVADYLGKANGAYKPFTEDRITQAQ
ncbi:bifunctional metallophosphatase/5'-nucleotidase [Aurantimonas sp. Leaf443]|uniref:bifunctional metallophosphatase/5'-nucleotidase n=1 Tax=Aurantimonas sp. Leaf443 TaxID=1736378 RepID=UPI0006F47746|nr:bifunctional metallophosphatase/5'-nucleotidase [Aurantimonas sp. Leaf443]KQT84014.1 multifunctional 2',3'-cyclic-nucleotide 2'-phosphodiesterase/5'-nucleotidase/3'-nucleotidase [Aurantimonas sp. Leaf443]